MVDIDRYLHKDHGPYIIQFLLTIKMDHIHHSTLDKEMGGPILYMESMACNIFDEKWIINNISNNPKTDE